MNKAKLENWYISVKTSDPYKAPEQGVSVLAGNIYNHPRFEDGKYVTTSPVRGQTEDGDIITQNTIYTLGTVKDDYEKEFPNARDRLLKTLPKIDV